MSLNPHTHTQHKWASFLYTCFYGVCVCGSFSMVYPYHHHHNHRHSRRFEETEINVVIYAVVAHMPDEHKRAN